MRCWVASVGCFDGGAGIESVKSIKNLNPEGWFVMRECDE
jgi:hypothetical protein